MSGAVNWSEFRRFPTLAAVGAVAIAVTVAWGAEIDISVLVETADIRRGELWRLLTSAFPHVNALHLLFNLYWLWEFGRPVEEHFGHAKTALLLALFAVSSAAFDFALSSGGVGLSGVGYGLCGLLWVLSRRDERFRGTITRSIILLFVAWFALCVVVTAKDVYQVANVAHAAGFAFGILSGFALNAPPRQRRLLEASIGALLLFGVWGATLGRPMIHLFGTAGYEEASWGYDALVAHRDKEAADWLRDATALGPRVGAYWFNLGIAYERLGDQSCAKAAFARAHALEPIGAAAPRLEKTN